MHYFVNTAIVQMEQIRTQVICRRRITVQCLNRYHSQIHSKSLSRWDLLTPESCSYGLSGKRFDLF
jgi:hypothetical protein